jgi:hypothetical protein
MVAFLLVAGTACGDEQRAAGARRVQAFSFVGGDLIVVEASTSHPTPRGAPASTEDADGRVLRYPAGSTGDPKVVLDGLTIQPAGNSALAFIGNRALMRNGCQIWLFGLDDARRELIPCKAELQSSGRSWVADGTAIYTDMKTPNTATAEGIYYIGKLDADGSSQPLLERVFGEDFTIDGGQLYFARPCPRLEASCPEAGVHRAALTGSDVSHVARLDPAQTAVDLAQRKVDRLAVGRGRIFLTTTTSWSNPSCAVHFARIGGDQPAKDLFISDDGRCDVAATDDGVVVCGDTEVIHVNAETSAARTLARTNHCESIQWAEGVAAWIDAERVLHTTNTR